VDPVRAASPIYTGERRGDLVRLDPALLRERVAQALRPLPQVAGAFLFGSATGFLRPDSDVDLGLILRRDPEDLLEDDTAWETELVLGRVGNHPVQVSILRERENEFAFRVLREGEPIYLADQRRVADFIERVARSHDDPAPFRSTFRHAMGWDLP
jgi:predicted nucleotidyltransferase